MEDGCGICIEDGRVVSGRRNVGYLQAWDAWCGYLRYGRWLEESAWRRNKLMCERAGRV